MAFDPRQAFTGVLNTIHQKDSTLWQIFNYIKDIIGRNSDDLKVLETQSYYSLQLTCKTPIAANDIADYWYTVNLPVDSLGNPIYKSLKLVKVIISAKTIPPAFDAVYDIRYSRNVGVTFVSLFSGISFSIPVNTQVISYGNMTVGTLIENDIIRLDGITISGSAGITVTILGVPQK